MLYEVITGNALLATGAIEFLATGFIRLTEGATPPVILSGLMLLMALLTNLVSNNAAAVIGTPVAVNIATSLGLPATPFILAVLFGANLSFATPMAYQTNLLVIVITSYSIHYTKLYETARPSACSPAPPPSSTSPTTSAPTR